MNEPDRNDFQQQAQEERPGFIREYIDFVRSNKKWWLIPIIIGLLAIGGLIILGGTSMAPLIYALF